ncbi:hypothetical protein [Neobacillus niacini]|uniref:hypothetical protein n=1 Tax=Neobacillus niacini TaxID=86668 RepID=UPI0005F0BD85|nr:hypothetical protein [Neobacillus niacini]
MYIYGKDYIKYLNDDSTGLLTYDQWKNKSSPQGSDKQISSERVETTRYAEGYYSPNVQNKNK